MNSLFPKFTVLLIVVIVSFCMCAYHQAAPIRTSNVVMSSNAIGGEIGHQPVLLVTHNHSNILADMWKNIPWPHGKKVVICDCDKSVVDKFDDEMAKVIVDRKHTEASMKTSLDMYNLRWKAMDTTILYLSNQTFKYAWVIENDVAFDPQTLANVMSKYANSTYDFITPGSTRRKDTWYWNKAQCNYACELRLGGRVSFCRLSKRLVDECIRLTRQNTCSYIEKFIPSVCAKNGWEIKQFEKDDIHPSYKLAANSDEMCNKTKLPLHKCTSHLDNNFINFVYYKLGGVHNIAIVITILIVLAIIIYVSARSLNCPKR